MKKGIFTSLFLFIVIQSAFSQVPQALNYQGYLTDTNGDPVNASVSILFSIYDAETNGNQLWSNTKTVLVEDGLYNVILGAPVKVIPYTVFDGSERYLGVKVGADSEMVPRTRLVSVGYAYRAYNADKVDGFDASSFVQSVDGVSPNSSGNIDLEAGPNVAITTDIPNNKITISATGGGGGGDSDWTISGDNMYSAVSGGVSIGTTVPHDGKFVVANSATDEAYIAFQPGGDANNDIVGLRASHSGNNTTKLHFGQEFSQNGSFIDQVTLVGATGFVGIGTAAPAGGLHVSGNGGNGTALFERSGKILALNPNYGGNNQFAHISTIVGSNMGLKLDANDQTALTIATDGKVGIGTTDPHDGKLVVANTDTDEAYISFQPGGAAENDFVGLRASESGNNTTKLHFGREFTIDTGFKELVTLAGATGNLGIGTENPLSKLSVGGDGKDTYTIYGEAGGENSYAVYGKANGYYGVGIYGKVGSSSRSAYAGYFAGRAHVNGSFSKLGGSFKIDHPLDPENKYLYHSFVESPDMMNIYNGNVVTDGSGYASVQLPEWFDALNKEFRYQLTVIGEFAQAIVYEKISNNRFSIKTDKPNIEVSWMVTGIRQDAFANKNRIPVEEMKEQQERGKYLYPEGFNMPKTAGIRYEE